MQPRLLSVPLGHGQMTYIKDRKVVVLGIDEDGNEEELPPGPISGSQKGTEFLFQRRMTMRRSRPPSPRLLQPLGQAAVAGSTGFSCLGQTGSGKTEMMHGTETTRERVAVSSRRCSRRSAADATDSISAAEDMYSVRMQFLSIVHELSKTCCSPIATRTTSSSSSAPARASRSSEQIRSRSAVSTRGCGCTPRRARRATSVPQRGPVVADDRGPILRRRGKLRDGAPASPAASG